MKRSQIFSSLISGLILIMFVVVAAPAKTAAGANLFGLMPFRLSTADVLSAIAKSKQTGEKPKDYLSEQIKQEIIDAFAAKNKKLEIHDPLQPFVIPGQGIVFVYEVRCGLRREGKDLMVDAVMFFPSVPSSKERYIKIKRAKAIPTRRHRKLMAMDEKQRVRLLMMLFNDNQDGQGGSKGARP
jgi:hypothetical protein